MEGQDEFHLDGKMIWDLDPASLWDFPDTASTGRCDLSGDTKQTPKHQSSSQAAAMQTENQQGQQNDSSSSKNRTVTATASIANQSEQHPSVANEDSQNPWSGEWYLEQDLKKGKQAELGKLKKTKGVEELHFKLKKNFPETLLDEKTFVGKFEDYDLSQRSLETEESGFKTKYPSDGQKILERNPEKPSKASNCINDNWGCKATKAYKDMIKSKNRANWSWNACHGKRFIIVNAKNPNDVAFVSKPFQFQFPGTKLGNKRLRVHGTSESKDRTDDYITVAPNAQPKSHPGKHLVDSISQTDKMFHLTAGGLAYFRKVYLTCDARQKNEIKKIKCIVRGRVWVYEYKMNGDNELSTGFLAQEIKEWNPTLVKEEHGVERLDLLGLMASLFSMQEDRNESMEGGIVALRRDYEGLPKKFEELRQKFEELRQKNERQDELRQQNERQDKLNEAANLLLHQIIFMLKSATSMDLMSEWRHEGAIHGESSDIKGASVDEKTHSCQDPFLAPKTAAERRRSGFHRHCCKRKRALFLIILGSVLAAGLIGGGSLFLGEHHHEAPNEACNSWIDNARSCDLSRASEQQRSAGMKWLKDHLAEQVREGQQMLQNYMQKIHAVQNPLYNCTQKAPTTYECTVEIYGLVVVGEETVGKSMSRNSAAARLATAISCGAFPSLL
mmetsp:Transcript_22420/g.43627  ORF Transcript_22420/g.43627 Transcript_22420/m.43627 type:complete len:672 (+) Transcript_22420:3-2018(+)